MFKFGFGIIEVGTVTPKQQYGNPKPRVFRLENDRALINRLGFNNDGLKKISERQGFKALEAKNIKDALKIVSSKEKKIIVLWGSTYGAGNALSLN